MTAEVRDGKPVERFICGARCGGKFSSHIPVMHRPCECGGYGHTFGISGRTHLLRRWYCNRCGEYLTPKLKTEVAG